MGFRAESVERPSRVERLYDVRCDECQRELQPLAGVADADGGWRWLQPDGGLPIRLISGYGMFFDSPSNQNPLLLLCRDCAERLLAAFPSFRRAIEQAARP